MQRLYQQLFSGLLFIGFGAATILLSSGYGLWDGTRVGSGLFPSLLGWVLVGIGVLVAGRGVLLDRHDAAAPPMRWNLRPILGLCGAITLYGLTVERFGNLVALGLAGLAAGFADRPNFKYLAIVYVAIVAFLWGFMIELIRLPFKLY